jgi:16S rRNA (cytidine1402-2'-O)-methyltransferase
LGYTKGKLYIVSTPIGNLGDMSLRAISTLRKVSLVAAEDTRHSKKLFTYHDIMTPITSYFEHNKNYKIPQLISELNKGKDLALISDAGTPSISDPGYRIVREAINHDIEIVSIPGASAVLAALVASGLPTDRFLFEGFLPTKKGRLRRIERVKDFDGTLIYYESPHRLVRSLKQFSQILGNRPAIVARELTKIYEEIKRGSLTDLSSFYSEKNVKGECVILIGKDDKNVYF